jgi:hypothetical protein
VAFFSESLDDESELDSGALWRRTECLRDIIGLKFFPISDVIPPV